MGQLMKQRQPLSHRAKLLRVKSYFLILPVNGGFQLKSDFYNNNFKGIFLLLGKSLLF